MNADPADAVPRALASGPEGACPPRIMAGYSGGLDSSVLLHALATAHPGRVRAIHVDHGLHADADAWAAHCRRVCDGLGLPLAIARVTVRDHGDGPEAAARDARQQAFHATLQAGEWLALAHHRDDQAETFLLRALRGSGPDGLAAMRPLRAFGLGWMWRPLLGLPRATLHAYAQRHGLDWIEDPSNAATDFDRNYLRHEVLPRLRARWPQAEAAFARAATLAAQADALMGRDDEAELARARTDDDERILRVDALLELAPESRARLLRLWVRRLKLPPLPGSALARIDHELLRSRHDAEPHYDWHNARIERWRGLLRASVREPAFPSDWLQLWDGREPLRLPEGSRLALAGGQGFTRPLLVRPRLGGERIELPARAHSSALKKLLQQHQMPPWQRRRLPLLVDPDSGRLLAAGDRIMSRYFDPYTVQAGARLYWQLA